MGAKRISRVGVSARTWAVLGAGVVISALSVIALRFLPATGSASTWVASAPDILISGLAAVVILWSRTRMDAHDPLRGSWLALGVGCVLFWGGETTFAAGLVAGASVVTTVSDGLFIASFPFVVAGLAMSFFAFRKGQDWVVPLVGGGLLGAFLAVELYVGALGKVASNTSIPLVERLIGLFYPMADVLFVLPWIFALIFMLVGVRKEPLSWPWWTVAAGVLVGVASDTAFAVQSANRSYAPGGLADVGWWLMYMSVCAAASLTVDIQETAKRHVVAVGSGASESATI
jgi:hypothetical protein